MRDVRFAEEIARTRSKFAPYSVLREPEPRAEEEEEEVREVRDDDE